PGVLYIGGPVARARIEELQSGLRIATVVAWSADQVIRERLIGNTTIARYRAVETESSIHIGQIAFIHLQITEFPTELQRVLVNRLREPVRGHISVIGLECDQIRWAHAKGGEKEPRHKLFSIGQTVGNNSQTMRVIETQRRQRCEAAARCVCMG